ncbi:Zn-ribbon domain-containing OB-fold protein [Streptomyces sp. NPDC102279]|uniref:Zn-ribbon domain-containing OB-fold protein n=1 Tax=Streptomyces sp. NPDC102279 TaxID=3366153 RepID=UPI0038075813
MTPTTGAPRPKPVPRPTDSTRPYWDAAARGELWIQRSVTTGAYVFYPRTVSPFGIHDELEWVRVSGLATLDSYVINHRPAPGFEAPHVIAIVKLEEGPRMLSTVVGVDPVPEQLVLDMPLRVDFEPRGEMSLPVFRPAEEGEAL